MKATETTETIRVVILNWEKYNPRSDVKNTQWFRLNNTLCCSQDIFTLNFEEKWCWISLLSVASQRQSGVLILNINWFTSYTQVSRAALVASLEKLARNACVTYTARPRSTTNERTNVRNTTSESDIFTVSEFDLEALYQQYPRKLGKKRGMEVCKKVITTSDRYSQVTTAVLNYKSEIRRLGTKPEFIKHFSTFMNNWEDYLDLTPCDDASNQVISVDKLFEVAEGVGSV